jgi:hypothetical protein
VQSLSGDAPVFVELGFGHGGMREREDKDGASVRALCVRLSIAGTHLHDRGPGQG